MIQKLIIKLILKKGGINVLLLVGDLIVKTTKSKKDDEMWAKIKPIIKDVIPFLIESAPKSGPTVLSSTTVNGVGKAPDLNNKARSVASWKVPLPSVFGEWRT